MRLGSILLAGALMLAAPALRGQDATARRASFPATICPTPAFEMRLLVEPAFSMQRQVTLCIDFRAQRGFLRLDEGATDQTGAVASAAAPLESKQLGATPRELLRLARALVEAAAKDLRTVPLRKPDGSGSIGLDLTFFRVISKEADWDVDFAVADNGAVAGPPQTELGKGIAAILDRIAKEGHPVQSKLRSSGVSPDAEGNMLKAPAGGAPAQAHRAPPVDDRSAIELCDFMARAPIQGERVVLRGYLQPGRHGSHLGGPPGGCANNQSGGRTFDRPLSFDVTSLKPEFMAEWKATTQELSGFFVKGMNRIVFLPLVVEGTVELNTPPPGQGNMATPWAPLQTIKLKLERFHEPGRGSY